MGVRGYEIPLRGLNDISLVYCTHSSNNYFLNMSRQIIRISKQPCNVLFII